MDKLRSSLMLKHHREIHFGTTMAEAFHKHMDMK